MFYDKLDVNILVKILLTYLLYTYPVFVEPQKLNLNFINTCNDPSIFVVHILVNDVFNCLSQLKKNVNLVSDMIDNILNVNLYYLIPWLNFIIYLFPV